MQYFYIPNTVFFLLISFRQIIFPSIRLSDRAQVDLHLRPRNLRVDKNRLAGRLQRYNCPAQLICVTP